MPAQRHDPLQRDAQPQQGHAHPQDFPGAEIDTRLYSAPPRRKFMAMLSNSANSITGAWYWSARKRAAIATTMLASTLRKILA